MRTHPDILTRRLDDGAILVHLASNRIFELNDTATRIWESIAEGLDVPAIAQRLVAEFDVTAVEADLETTRLVQMLRDEGVLLP